MLRWPTDQGHPGPWVFSVQNCQLKNWESPESLGKLIYSGRSYPAVERGWLQSWDLKQFIKRDTPPKQCYQPPKPGTWWGSSCDWVRKLGSRSGLRTRGNNRWDSAWYPQTKAFLSFGGPWVCSSSPGRGLSVWAGWGGGAGRQPLPEQPVSPPPPLKTPTAPRNLHLHCMGRPIIGETPDTGL